MRSSTLLHIAADLTLFVHVLFVAFIVFGLLSIFVGRLFSWRWVRNLWFRIVHVAAIVVVVLQSWAGMVCPLTTLEMWLRSKAGDTVYAGTFIAYWLESILYYRAPPWVFAVAYTLFAALVIASWFWVPPRRR